MSSLKIAVLSLIFALTGSCGNVLAKPGLGKPVSEEEIAGWNIDVGPDGAGLPAGWGSVSSGRSVYEIHCAACHGAKGQGGPADQLVGGKGSLAGQTPLRTVGSYWPYAPTLFDYIRRAMPYNAPLSLTDRETYAVTAYLLFLNGIVGADYVADKRTLPSVLMPNRNGFVTATGNNK